MNSCLLWYFDIYDSMVGLKLSGLPLPNGCYLKHLCMVWHHWIRIYNLRSMHYHLQRLAKTYAHSPISDIQLYKRICVSRGHGVCSFFHTSVPLAADCFKAVRTALLDSSWKVDHATTACRGAQNSCTSVCWTMPCLTWSPGLRRYIAIKKRQEMIGIDSLVRKKTDKRIWMLKNVPSIFEWRCFSTKEPTVQSRIVSGKLSVPFCWLEPGHEIDTKDRAPTSTPT